MKPEEVDRILAQAAHCAAPPDISRRVIERVENVLLSDLRPVRPLAPPWASGTAFLILFAAVAAAAAAALGLHGVAVLGGEQRALIFPSLLLAALLAAAACVRQMRPAAGASLETMALVVSALGFPALFWLLFRGYDTGNLVSEGVPCLIAGMSVAIPTGILAALVLRRGFVMDWSRAGLAAGTLAGLAGLAMLELHCPNLKAIHVIVWHVGVVVFSAALGLATGSAADRLRRRKAIQRAI
jgi:hypothetical protein